MLPGRVQIVCLAVGDEYRPEYLIRFEGMLKRHMPVPFDLSCIIDRPRELPPSFATIDASDWPKPRPGMRLTTYKLSLYDPARLPFESFLYLDTTLVIHRDMTELLQFAYGRPEALVVQKDWNYDVYNTCAMRIWPGEPVAEITRRYEAGSAYAQRVWGDQDFATAVIREQRMQGSVATFPDGMIASYKGARRESRKGIRAAKAALDRATIVKFHGDPKMHELLDPRYRLRIVIQKRRPWHRDAWFWVRELRERW